MAGKTNISLLVWAIVALVVATATGASNVEDIAKKMCSKPKHIVSGVTEIHTMFELSQFLRNLPMLGHPLSGCRNKYLGSLDSLINVFTIGNENVCGDDKLSALEDFNREFLSTTKRDKEQQSKDFSEAPELVKVFFMHYAYLVSSRCKQSLVDQLKNNEGFDKWQLEQSKELDTFLDSFSKKLAINMSKRGYEDLVLPWKLVDSLPLARANAPFLRDPYVDAQHPLPTRMSVRANSASKIYSMQQRCRQTYQPLYSELILPVMRLVGMGLYKKDEELEQMLRKDELLQRAFQITQLCETLLPIEFFEDNSLGPNVLVTMNVDKANRIRSLLPADQRPSALPEVAKRVSVPPAHSFENLDALPSMRNTYAADLLAIEISYRRKIHEQVTKRMTRLAKLEMKSRFKGSTNKYIQVTNTDGPTNELVLEGELVLPKESKWRTALRIVSLPFVIILLIVYYVLGCIFDFLEYIFRAYEPAQQ